MPADKQLVSNLLHTYTAENIIVDMEDEITFFAHPQKRLSRSTLRSW